MKNTFRVKSKTNDGDQAKQYFNTLGTCQEDAALVVRKFILNDKEKMPMMEVVKTFKGLNLHFQWFSIRLNTLERVVNNFSKKEIKEVELKTERSIDEVFNDPETGAELKCIESLSGCQWCFYSKPVNNHCENRICSHDERSDKKDVKFVVIK